MEDAATAEICRTQLWQWLRFKAPLEDGRRFTRQLFEEWFQDELSRLDPAPHLKSAADLLHALVTADELQEFLTTPAYAMLADEAA